jgi:nitroreductase
MNSILDFLQNRNSAPRLTAPGPSDSELSQMLQAATRAPDHARLRPWRFLAISGERREAFGEVLERALLRRNPEADDTARTKARNAPLRAPLLMVVVASICEHPKVPAIEQRLSAGCAAHGLLLAAEALGFAGVWRTGDAAFDRGVMADLGLSSNEEITGFLYLGTREGNAKVLPNVELDSHLTRW